jgi:hypothetical protein
MRARVRRADDLIAQLPRSRSAELDLRLSCFASTGLQEPASRSACRDFLPALRRTLDGDTEMLGVARIQVSGGEDGFAPR